MSITLGLMIIGLNVGELPGDLKAWAQIALVALIVPWGIRNRHQQARQESTERSPEVGE